MSKGINKSTEKGADKRKRIGITAEGVGIVLAAGVLIYIKAAAPPGEAWISYNNQRVLDSIEKQLHGMKMEEIRKKEPYILEKSIREIQDEAAKGTISYEEMTAICLYRIQTLDQKEKGYNSVISVNPHAIEDARERDRERKDNPKAGRGMYGIPVMLKDNMNASDMATTVGTAAFSDYYPSEDAELVKTLKENGAVILGKNNLSEFSGYVSSVMPAGYSGNKGQTINPFGPLKLSASGSSSGSAVAVTCNLAPVSVGTETDGSVIAPAAMNSVVGFKPSRGSISSEGIFPLIKKIDTPGILAKCVEDAGTAYNGAANTPVSPDYRPDALKGKTIGLIRYEYNDKEKLDELKKTLQDMGVHVVEPELNENGIIVFHHIALSFKKDFEDYAQAYHFPIQTLEELIVFNRNNPQRNIKYGQDLLEEAVTIENADMDRINGSIRNADDALSAVFDRDRLDGLVFLNSSGTTAPAAAGYPELTVPFGTGTGNAPQGATFVAEYGEDQTLLEMGYSFECFAAGRVDPLDH